MQRIARHRLVAHIHRFPSVASVCLLLIFPVCEGQTQTEGIQHVKRVIDGDTFELIDGERVRLIGIDTPETARGRRVDEPFADVATEFTRSMVEGRDVRLEFDVQLRDRYGRLLAYVYLDDGTFLNAELVRLGFATVATYPPNVTFADEFLHLQREARKAKRGVWE
jgi:micrococcal nuclease